MIRYHFDLYPRDDPRDGARVVRFTKLQSAEYRGEANGTGSGQFSIRADTADAQLIDPRGLQYVRVVREDTVAVTENVVGGFWLEQGDFSALDEQGTRLLNFGGAGTLAYLSRAIMASHTYVGAAGELSSLSGGQDPFDDLWRLYAQGYFAGGDKLGAVLYRAVAEAMSYQAGAYTHKHADFTIHTDTHAQDRTSSALPDLTLGFSGDDDSDSNAWAADSGEFKAQIGENVLQVVHRLMEAGLYVEMDPDTFELRAWEADDHRRTRTGTTWGASVVYFTRPTGDAIDTGNIKSDAKRAIHSYLKRSWLLAGGSDVYGDATGTTDIPWEGFYYADVNSASAAAAIAGVQIGARDDAGDTLRIRGRLGTDTSNGYYRPFEDALLDDLVTLNTGTDQFDLENQNFPIAAITVGLRPGGDWDVWYDLGSSYTTTSSRQFQVSPVPAHNHPPNLCQALTISEGTCTRFYFTENSAAGSVLTKDAAWEQEQSAFASGDPLQLSQTPTSTSTGEVAWDSANIVASQVIFRQYWHTLTAGEAAILAAGGASVRFQMLARSRYGVGVDEMAQFNYLEASIRVYRPSTTTFIGTALAVGAGTVGPEFEHGNPSIHQNRSLTGVLASVAGATTNDVLVVEIGVDHDAPTTGATGAVLRIRDDAASDLPEDETETANLNAWLDICTGSAVSGTGNNPELVGTSNQAARCDHKHHVVRDSAPTVNDDTDLGYPVGTFWVYVDDADNPTEIFATYLLVDNTDGAAVWLLQADPSSTSTPGTTLTIEELDGSPSEGYDTLKVPNDSLTDNGDGSATLSYILPSHGGRETVAAHGATGTTETIDLADGNVHTATLDADCTFTFSGATNGVACSWTLGLTQDGTGNHAITLPASVVNASDLEGALDITASNITWYSFWTLDGGTTVYGVVAGAAASVSSSVWAPLMAQDPSDSKWYVVVDGDGSAVMVET